MQQQCLCWHSLDEWNGVERIGVNAKIYNRFVKASVYAVVVWDIVMKETKGNTISANTVIHNLYRFDAENFKKIYGLDEDVFKQLNSQSCGVTLASCRVARLLSEGLEDHTKIEESKVKNIY